MKMFLLKEIKVNLSKIKLVMEKRKGQNLNVKKKVIQDCGNGIFEKEF